MQEEQLNKALLQLKQIYQKLENLLPERNCQGLADCCRFALTNETPHVTLAEAEMAWRAWKATGRKQLPQNPDGSCCCLDSKGRCMIYQGRPFACRTHFCQLAGGAMERGSVRELIQQLDAMDQQLGGNGARRLPEALASMAKPAKNTRQGSKRRR